MTDEPKNVTIPAAPDFMNIFDWNDSKLQEWAKDAVNMQDKHVDDNNNTAFYAFDRAEYDAIQLRLCITLFGMKVNLFFIPLLQSNYF